MLNRQNRRPMLTRHARLLQILPQSRARLTDPAALGTRRTGEDRAAGEIGGRDGAVASAGDQPGTLRAGGPGRWTDADCERESDSVGDFGTEECG